MKPPTLNTDQECLLRQNERSYCVAPLWAIGYTAGDGWQVFYRGIDANFRLGVADKRPSPTFKFYPTFAAAARWLSTLNEKDVEAIVVDSCK